MLSSTAKLTHSRRARTAVALEHSPFLVIANGRIHPNCSALAASAVPDTFVTANATLLYSGPTSAMAHMTPFLSSKATAAP